MTYDLGHRHSIYTGVSKVLGDSQTYTRIGGAYTAAKGIQLEGMYRLSNRNFRDVSVFLHFKF